MLQLHSLLASYGASLVTEICDNGLEFLLSTKEWGPGPALVPPNLEFILPCGS